MSIAISTIIKNGLLVGVQWFNPDEENDTFLLIFDLLLIRLTFEW